MRNYFKYLLDMPKTVYFNFKCLPFRKALVLPFYISHSVKLDLPCRTSLKAIIHIPDDASRFSIRFVNGGSSDVCPNKNGLIRLKDGSRCTFGKNVQFAAGCSLRVDGGVFCVGNNFSANRNCEISCVECVEIGDDVLLAFRIGIRDSDGHSVVYDGVRNSTKEKVVIGDHVWICGEADIMKGAHIGSDSVIAFRSLVLKGNYENNSILGGSPAKMIRNNINWEF